MTPHRTPTTALLALFALLSIGVSEALAHGEATLKTTARSVAAGREITVDGADFEPGEAHRLILRGALDQHELRTVTAGADSTFSVHVTIPSDARPGQYRLVAVAPDGDDVASLDLAVTAALPDRADAEERTQGTGGGAVSGMGEARADELPIERSRSGIEWGIIGLLIGLAGGFGLGLLRRA